MKTQDQKFTVICTITREGKEFNFQIKGWTTEKKCFRLSEKYNSTLVDYLCGRQGDRISCEIHARF